MPLSHSLVNEIELMMTKKPAEPFGPERVLLECIELMKKKGSDYQNPHSTVRQADYYRRGIATIYDIMHGKMLRIQSVMEAMEHDPKYEQNFESMADSFKDLISYSAFAAAYIRGEIDGQDENRDFLNRPLP